MFFIVFLIYKGSVKSLKTQINLIYLRYNIIFLAKNLHDSKKRCTFATAYKQGSGFSAVGSAHVWGARGRWFESSNPDQIEVQAAVYSSLDFFFYSNSFLQSVTHLCHHFLVHILSTASTDIYCRRNQKTYDSVVLGFLMQRYEIINSLILLFPLLFFPIEVIKL